jgi:hypothetical protein
MSLNKFYDFILVLNSKKIFYQEGTFSYAYSMFYHLFIAGRDIKS